MKFEIDLSSDLLKMRRSMLKGLFRRWKTVLTVIIISNLASISTHEQFILQSNDFRPFPFHIFFFWLIFNQSINDYASNLFYLNRMCEHESQKITFKSTEFGLCKIKINTNIKIRNVDYKWGDLNSMQFQIICGIKKTIESKL